MEAGYSSKKNLALNVVYEPNNTTLAIYEQNNTSIAAIAIFQCIRP